MDKIVEQLADVLTSLQDLHLDSSDTLDNASLARQILKVREDVDHLVGEVKALRQELRTR